MFELIKTVWDICVFKKGPESLPHSLWLLRLLLFVDVIVSVLLASISAGWIRSGLQAVVGVVLIIVFAWAMLVISGKSARFLQTTAALLGTDALISFFAIPATATMAIGFSNAVVFLVTTGLIIWHWAITGHIIRRALGKPLVFSLGLAFLYILACYQVMGFLFPTLGNI
jgi:hypothetical protein